MRIQLLVRNDSPDSCCSCILGLRDEKQLVPVGVSSSHSCQHQPSTKKCAKHLERRCGPELSYASFFQVIFAVYFAVADPVATGLLVKRAADPSLGYNHYNYDLPGQGSFVKFDRFDKPAAESSSTRRKRAADHHFSYDLPGQGSFVKFDRFDKPAAESSSTRRKRAADPSLGYNHYNYDLPGQGSFVKFDRFDKPAAASSSTRRKRAADPSLGYNHYNYDLPGQGSFVKFDRFDNPAAETDSAQ